MSRERIEEKFRDILKMAKPQLAEVIFKAEESSGLQEDLGLNSIGLPYIAVAVEEYFSISFEDVDFSDFKTVKNVVDYIEAHAER